MLVGITGGTGFIGTPLVARHLERGDRVRVLSRSARKDLPAGVEGAVGDLTVDDDRLASFCEGLDVLYHCAGELRDETRMRALHVDGTKRLLDAAVGRVGRWVQLSSVGVYGPHRSGDVTEETKPNPQGAYEVTKAESDELVLAAAKTRGLDVAVLRPSIVFGVAMPNRSIHQMVSMIEKGLFFFIGKPGASANYVEVTNVVDALVLCATKKEASGRVYNLSDWCSMEDFVGTIAKALGRPAPKTRVPDGAIRLVARTLGRLPKVPLTESRVDALSTRNRYVNDRIERELGFRHSVSVTEGVRRFVEARKNATAPKSDKPKACIVVAHEITIRAFLKAQIEEMVHDYDVTAVVNTERTNLFEELGIDAKLVPIAIERNISPPKDLAALFALLRFFRRERFDLVHSVTPKAGLLAMTASRVAGVPNRIHTFTGQVWATRKGAGRSLLKNLDRVLVACASQILVDSPSQRDFLVSEGVVSKDKSIVLGKGSVSGVDDKRFRPNPAARARIRLHLGLAADDLVLLFVGRLNSDKGIFDLTKAFTTVARENPRLRLVIVGPDEQRIQTDIVQACGDVADRLRFESFTNEVEAFMAAADVLVLPSYREGFGSVVIEAAACGVPAVASRIYGLTDAVADGETGILHPPRDPDALAAALREIVTNDALRERLGKNALLRARQEFSQEVLTNALLELYARLVPAKQKARPSAVNGHASHASGDVGQARV